MPFAIITNTNPKEGVVFGFSGVSCQWCLVVVVSSWRSVVFGCSGVIMEECGVWL